MRLAMRCVGPRWGEWSLLLACGSLFRTQARALFCSNALLHMPHRPSFSPHDTRMHACMQVAVWAENDVGAVEAFAEAMGLGRGAALDDLVLLQKVCSTWFLACILV